MSLLLCIIITFRLSELNKFVLYFIHHIVRIVSNMCKSKYVKSGMPIISVTRLCRLLND